MLLKKKQEKSKAEWHITLCPQVINNVLYIGGGGGGEGVTKDCPQPLTLSWIDNDLFTSKTQINFID